MIILLYYYNKLSLSIIRCLLSRDIYLFSEIYLSIPTFCVSFSTVSVLFCGEFQTFVILSGILLPIKSQVTAAVGITYYEAVLSASLDNCLE